MMITRVHLSAKQHCLPIDDNTFFYVRTTMTLYLEKAIQVATIYKIDAAFMYERLVV